MKNIFLVFFFSLLPALSRAQTDKPFSGTVYCREYGIYLVMDFYEKNVTIAGQEFMGKMDGYIGDEKDFRKWLVLDTEIVSETEASLDIINTEGSEDLTAVLTFNPDGTYTLRQTGGSVLKIARGQKWVKLPKSTTFTTGKTEGAK